MLRLARPRLVQAAAGQVPLRLVAAEPKSALHRTERMWNQHILFRYRTAHSACVVGLLGDTGRYMRACAVKSSEKVQPLHVTIGSKHSCASSGPL